MDTTDNFFYPYISRISKSDSLGMHLTVDKEENTNSEISYVVKVLQVKPSSPADFSGLLKNDIILEAHGISFDSSKLDLKNKGIANVLKLLGSLPPCFQFKAKRDSAVLINNENDSTQETSSEVFQEFFCYIKRFKTVDQIGVQVAVKPTALKPELIVVYVFDSSPAFSAGVNVGDVVLSVNGVSFEYFVTKGIDAVLEFMQTLPAAFVFHVKRKFTKEKKRPISSSSSSSSSSKAPKASTKLDSEKTSSETITKTIVKKIKKNPLAHVNPPLKKQNKASSPGDMKLLYQDTYANAIPWSLIGSHDPSQTEVLLYALLCLIVLEGRPQDVSAFCDVLDNSTLPKSNDSVQNSVKTTASRRIKKVFNDALSIDFRSNNYLSNLSKILVSFAGKGGSLPSPPPVEGLAMVIELTKSNEMRGSAYQSRMIQGATGVSELLWVHSYTLWGLFCDLDTRGDLIHYERYYTSENERPASIAELFEIDVDDLIAVNQWRWIALLLHVSCAHLLVSRYPDLEPKSRLKRNSQIDIKHSSKIGLSCLSEASSFLIARSSSTSSPALADHEGKVEHQSPPKQMKTIYPVSPSSGLSRSQMRRREMKLNVKEPWTIQQLLKLQKAVLQIRNRKLFLQSVKAFDGCSKEDLISQIHRSFHDTFHQNGHSEPGNTVSPSLENEIHVVNESSLSDVEKKTIALVDNSEVLIHMFPNIGAVASQLELSHHAVLHFVQNQTRSPSGFQLKFYSQSNEVITVHKMIDEGDVGRTNNNVDEDHITKQVEELSNDEVSGIATEEVEDTPQAVQSKPLSNIIVLFDVDGEVVEEFSSVRAASTQLKISVYRVKQCLLGQTHNGLFLRPKYPDPLSPRKQSIPFSSSSSSSPLLPPSSLSPKALRTPRDSILSSSSSPQSSPSARPIRLRLSYGRNEFEPSMPTSLKPKHRLVKSVAVGMEEGPSGVADAKAEFGALSAQLNSSLSTPLTLTQKNKEITSHIDPNCDDFVSVSTNPSFRGMEVLWWLTNPNQRLPSSVVHTSSAFSSTKHKIAKVWSYSGCDILPSASTTVEVVVKKKLGTGSTFEYDAKSCEVVMYKGEEFTILFYHLADAHQGHGWVHNFNPNLPGIRTISEDLDCCDINDCEWELIAESSGLDFDQFNEDECAEAWDQLWGTGTRNVRVLTGCEAKRMKLAMSNEIEYNLAKPYVCTHPHCSYRSAIRRCCRLHPKFKCEHDGADNGVSHVDFCDICGKDDNEDLLLICENCITGWSSSEEEEANGAPKSKKQSCTGSAHSYCVGFREVPQGGWYCSACLNSDV